MSKFVKTALLSCLSLAVVLQTGCKTAQTTVIAGTGTVLGFQIDENPATQMPHIKFGYARQELAIVPTNKRLDTNGVMQGKGALDSADAIMEIQYQNIMRGGGLYQRLAVGTTAVATPVTMLLFSKNPDGVLNTNLANAIATSLKSIPAVNSSSTSAKVPLATAFTQAADKTTWNATAVQAGYASFQEFLAKPDLSIDEVLRVKTLLIQAALLK